MALRLDRLLIVRQGLQQVRHLAEGAQHGVLVVGVRRPRVLDRGLALRLERPAVEDRGGQVREHVVASECVLEDVPPAWRRLGERRAEVHAPKARETCGYWGEGNSPVVSGRMNGRGRSRTAIRLWSCLGSLARVLCPEVLKCGPSGRPPLRVRLRSLRGRWERRAAAHEAGRMGKGRRARVVAAPRISPGSAPGADDPGECMFMICSCVCAKSCEDFRHWA